VCTIGWYYNLITLEIGQNREKSLNGFYQKGQLILLSHEIGCNTHTQWKSRLRAIQWWLYYRH